MKAPDWLPSVVLTVGLVLITINFWYLVLVPQRQKKQVEGYISGVVSPDVDSPSEAEAAQHYRSLLIYIKNNTLKGVKVINDFHKRVYGKIEPIPDSFDPRKIMDNFVNPITGM